MPAKSCDVCGERKPRHTRWDGPSRRIKRVAGQSPSKCNGTAHRQCHACASVAVDRPQ